MSNEIDNEEVEKLKEHLFENEKPKLRNKLLEKFLSRCFWIWVTGTILIFKDGRPDDTVQWIIWIVLCTLFYGGDVLKVKIAQAIGNANVSVGVSAGVQTNINASKGG